MKFFGILIFSLLLNSVLLWADDVDKTNEQVTTNENVEVEVEVVRENKADEETVEIEILQEEEVAPLENDIVDEEVDVTKRETYKFRVDTPDGQVSIDLQAIGKNPRKAMEQVVKKLHRLVKKHALTGKSEAQKVEVEKRGGKCKNKATEKRCGKCKSKATEKRCGKCKSKATEKRCGKCKSKKWHGYQQDRGYHQKQDRGYHQSQDRGYHQKQDRGYHQKQDRGYHQSQGRGYHQDRGYHQKQVRGYHRGSRNDYRDHRYNKSDQNFDCPQGFNRRGHGQRFQKHREERGQRFQKPREEFRGKQPGVNPLHERLRRKFQEMESRIRELEENMKNMSK